MVFVALGDDKKHPDHVLAVVQHFDYMNNTAYTFGGQSLGATLSSRFRLSNKVALRTRLEKEPMPDLKRVRALRERECALGYEHTCRRLGIAYAPPRP